MFLPPHSHSLSPPQGHLPLIKPKQSFTERAGTTQPSALVPGHETLQVSSSFCRPLSVVLLDPLSCGLLVKAPRLRPRPPALQSLHQLPSLWFQTPEISKSQPHLLILEVNLKLSTRVTNHMSNRQSKPSFVLLLRYILGTFHELSLSTQQP